MEKDKQLPLAIIILAISIVFSSIWIGQSLKQIGYERNEIAKESVSVSSLQSDILGLEEAAKYLDISKSELLYIVEGKGSTINYIKINGKYIFSKEGLDKWVQSSRLEIQQ
ncbi:helix-turn-helix domain-containing protein [Alkaliphilus pronyensis]|uniref:Helix-turn-helix domain-containing protein n=1 Tax=Alkaliphilus pronyensis TaxID=1482732 RepID=A0A6I0F5E8_9FIRM|nr:helix-turn-helix domain-containing protein [Alkaliphilus pronyensis]KAB3530923.1 helix-turn-helix domain-containing protein [Alkaliphilus pronyensis]